MSNNDDKLKKAFQQMGKNDAKLKQAFIELRNKTMYPFGANVELGDKGLGSGKVTPAPPKEIYVPQDKISDEDWEKIKKSYRTKFVGLDVPIELIGRYLDNYWDNWNNGYYPNPEKFLDTMDKVFSDFADTIPKKGNQSFTNILWFDELIQKFQNKIAEITWDGSKDWERTWDGKIYNDILIEDAKGIEEEIKIFLKKRIKHGLELTDEMKNFKGVDVIMKEQQPKPPPEPEPEEPPVQKGDGELASAHNLIKRQKKKIQALQLRKKKPTTEMEMIELINRNLKKNGKCNNEACGKEVKVDGETIKAWIKEFGLTRYATNPDHRK